MDYKEKFKIWLNSGFVDEVTKQELLNIKDEKEIEDRFYKDLEFGTGGLRGIIGAGSNRMNTYTVGKATQGLADFLNSTYFDGASVAIAYDSRNKSQEFAETAARTLCANGIKVYLFESLRPTPMLSFTVRQLKCQAGIVITASHNPKQYNGYKVYGEDGGQVTDKNARDILYFIEKIEHFRQVKDNDKYQSIETGMLNMIGEAVDKIYIDNVKGLSIRRELIELHGKNLKIIYTPIHGTGNIPIRRVLKELGYESVFVVKEQELPDGNFPTAPYPNPEEPKVFEIALKMADTIRPDIIFGTDPDCDRIGVVVKDEKGNYQVLNGNQTGVLLTHYILDSLKDNNELPENGAVVKTIVTTDMAKKIAKEYNIELVDVLTGFKYIGEKIKEFEEKKDKSYLFGFEESFGYLAGTFVRDKDAVIASMLICEMALYYKSKGMSLYEALLGLYKKYGFYKESLISIELKGKEGAEKIASALEYLRNSSIPSINSVKVAKYMDYYTGVERVLETGEGTIINLPKSNVLKFVLEDESWFVVRPSGTEPKMKIYISTVADSEEKVETRLKDLKDSVMNLINGACNQ